MQVLQIEYYFEYERFYLADCNIEGYKFFLKAKNKRNPVIRAYIPFFHPKVFDRIEDSCIHDNTANIIPNPEIKSQISFFQFIFLV